jgi:anti-anti-sigma factor
MAESRLEVRVRKESGLAILDLDGDINAFAESALVAAYLEAIEDPPGALVLNFGQVDYINSTGIALIVGLLARARADKRPVIAFGLSEHYTEIFDITRLSDFMQLVPDEPAARRATIEEKSR